MSFLNSNVISEIVAACFVPVGTGAPIHNNRKSHGLAYNYDCEITYRFSTGEVFKCTHGECIYLPKGSNYTVDKAETSKDLSQGVFAINFQTLNDSQTVSTPFKTNKMDSLLSSFKKAEKSWISKTTSFNEICFSELYKIISNININETSFDIKNENRAKKILKPALDFISKNFDSEYIDTATLASLCNVSEVYLRRLFNKAFSVSPSVYIRNVRINYAKELLKTGEYSVTSIAYLSGFNDTSYFSREFKKILGVSPIEYKSGQY